MAKDTINGQTDNTRSKDVTKLTQHRSEFNNIAAAKFQEDIKQLDVLLESLLNQARQEDIQRCMTTSTGDSDNWESRIMRVRYVLAFD